MLVGSAIVAWVLLRSREATGRTDLPEQSPLRLATAIQMVVAFQLVLLAIPFVQRLWGARGVLVSAAAVGLTDMDALTYSMARLGAREDAALAAKAIAVGILANTLVKLSLVLALGAPPFRKAAGPRPCGTGGGARRGTPDLGLSCGGGAPPDL